MFVTSGRADAPQAAEWIHQAYRFSQRSRQRNPLLGLVIPLERMLQGPGASLSAFEPLLDSEDPWVRALARFHLGKMRIVLGQGGRDAEANLEPALAEFRALGERYGISLALSELAEQSAMRGDFANACEHDEQAAAAITEVGATEDVIRMRTGQALMFWLKGDQDASVAAIAEAGALRRSGHLAGCAGRARAPKVALARWAATPTRPATNSASRPPCWVTTRSGRISARELHDARISCRRSQ